MIPMCQRKGLSYGVLQRSCIQGPILFWGNSSPTLPGLTLNMFSTPPSFRPSGGRLVPVSTLGCSPTGLSPFIFLCGMKMLPWPLILFCPWASGPWEGPRGCRCQCGCSLVNSGKAPITYHYFCAASLPNSILSHFL